MAKFRTIITQTVGVEDQAPALWLSRERVIQHYNNTEGYDEGRAVLKWDEDFANTDVERVGVGANTELVARGILVTMGLRGREVSRAI